MNEAKKAECAAALGIDLATLQKIIEALGREGPILWGSILRIIEIFKSKPVPPMVYGTGKCPPELASALCGAECAVIEALVSVVQAKCAACCDHDD